LINKCIFLQNTVTAIEKLCERHFKILIVDHLQGCFSLTFLLAPKASRSLLWNSSIRSAAAPFQRQLWRQRTTSPGCYAKQKGKNLLWKPCNDRVMFLQSNLSIASTVAAMTAAHTSSIENETKVFPGSTHSIRGMLAFRRLIWGKTVFKPKSTVVYCWLKLLVYLWFTWFASFEAVDIMWRLLRTHTGHMSIRINDASIKLGDKNVLLYWRSSSGQTLRRRINH
jgi:hypothetical protein